MQHSTRISASDIMRFAVLDDFGDIIKKLCLPPDVPRWQQLVRAAVLLATYKMHQPCLTATAYL